MKSNLFFAAIAAFIGGVFVRSFFAELLPWAAFSALLGLVFLLLARLTALQKFFAIAGIVVLAFSAGILRYEAKDASATSRELARAIDQEVILRGEIAGEPEDREKNLRFVMEADGIYVSGGWRELNGEKILVYANRYPQFAYGDILEVRGTLKEPENFSDFGWREYLAKDEIFFQIYRPEIKKLGDGGLWIKRALFRLKNNFMDSLSRALPEPHASFMAGLTIGAKKSMPPDVLEDFRKAGIVHLVVLSGYNITVVAENIGRVLKFLPFPFGAGIAASIAGIILFSVMTGASATIVRASVMAILALLARSTGKIYEVTIALLFAGFIMVMHNPKILRFDPSFQLSFLATLGLIYVAPRIERWLGFLPEKFGLRAMVSATLSAQIAVLPLILHLMGTFSVVALPVNILVLMFIPVTMLLGFLVWSVGLLHPILSLPFAWSGWALLNYELGVSHFFASLPGASFLISNFSGWMLAVSYVVMAVLVFLPQIKNFLQKLRQMPAGDAAGSAAEDIIVDQI